MRALLAALVLTILGAGTAWGAEGSLLVAGEAFPEGRVTFDLDPAWEQQRGEMAGTPMLGRYTIRAPGRPEGEECLLSLTTVGLAVRRRQRPVLRRGILTLHPTSWWGAPRLRIAHASRRASVSMYRTRLGSRATGVAVLPTPSWIRPRRPVTVVRIEIGSALNVLVTTPEGVDTVDPTPEQRSACDAFVERTLGPALRGALRSVRITRRRG